MRARTLPGSNTIGSAGHAAISAACGLNFVLRAAYGCEALEPELAARYRVPHVRALLRTRVMCQAGRATGVVDARGGGGSVMAWLCERAPLWVVVAVCALLHEE